MYIQFGVQKALRVEQGFQKYGLFLPWF